MFFVGSVETHYYIDYWKTATEGTQTLALYISLPKNDPCYSSLDGTSTDCKICWWMGV